jgi:hypothetical protein
LVTLTIIFGLEGESYLVILTVLYLDLRRGCLVILTVLYLDLRGVLFGNFDCIIFGLEGSLIW